MEMLPAVRGKQLYYRSSARALYKDRKVAAKQGLFPIHSFYYIYYILFALKECARPTTRVPHLVGKEYYGH